MRELRQLDSWALAFSSEIKPAVHIEGWRTAGFGL